MYVVNKMSRARRLVELALNVVGDENLAENFEVSATVNYYCLFNVSC